MFYQRLKNKTAIMKSQHIIIKTGKNIFSDETYLNVTQEKSCKMISSVSFSLLSISRRKELAEATAILLHSTLPSLHVIRRSQN